MDRFISVNQAYDTLKNMTCSTSEYTFAKEVINNTHSVEAIAKEDFRRMLQNLEYDIEDLILEPDYEAAVMNRVRDNGFNTAIKSCLHVLRDYIEEYIPL